MAGKNGSIGEQGAAETAYCASVSFDLTMSELQTLITLCGKNGEFELGIKLAEKKSRLQSNVRRMEKDAEKLAAAG